MRLATERQVFSTLPTWLARQANVGNGREADSIEQQGRVRYQVDEQTNGECIMRIPGHGRHHTVRAGQKHRTIAKPWLNVRPRKDA